MKDDNLPPTHWIPLSPCSETKDVNEWGEIVVKNCPFCKTRLMDNDRMDTLHTERTPSGGRRWLIHCPTIIGGCGVEMRGETEAEVLAKWDRRTH